MLLNYFVWKGLNDFLFIKVIKSVLVKELLVFLRSLVVDVFFKLWMIVEDVFIILGFFIVIGMIVF